VFFSFSTLILLVGSFYLHCVGGNVKPCSSNQSIGMEGEGKGGEEVEGKGRGRWCPPLFAGVPPVGSGWRCDFLSEWLSNCVMFEDDCIRIRDVNETFSF